jgi:putative flippase GtrA
MQNTNTIPLSLNQKITGLINKNPVILQLMRFAAIGVLNTAVDFLVLNFLSKAFNISSGFKLGGVNIPGFILAVAQSYVWNKYWAFSASSELVSVWKNFWRLVAVGALGAVSVLVVLLGAKYFAPAGYYLICFLLFLVMEIVLLEVFGILKNTPSQQNTLAPFLIISGIGLLINIFIVAQASHLALSANVDLNKNYAKILAVGVALFWNFMGYKLVVFKK